MRTIFACMFFMLPCLATAQTTDSLVIVKQVDSLLRLLRPLIEQQKLEDALAVVATAEEKTLKAFGEGHAAYATCLAFRGKIAQRKEQFKEAADFYLQAMALQEKIYGRESPQFTISLSTLSTIYLSAGEYIAAEPLIEETLRIREKLVGKQHPDYARTLGSYGSLNYLKANYGEAEKLYLDALAIFEKTLGKKHPEYSFVLGNLSSVYTETGNFAKAEPLLLTVSEINAAAYGKQSPTYLKSKLNYAVLYYRMSKYDSAEKQYLDVLDIFAQGANKESADYALALNNLASIYLERGDYVKAEPLVIEAEQVCAKVNGKRHIEYALSLKNLGHLYAAKGDAGKAETFFLQAHEINTNYLEKNHPGAALSAGLLANLYQKTNRIEAAATRFLESERINRYSIEKAAGYASEAEMANYLPPFQQTSDQFYAFVQRHPNDLLAEAAFDHALFYKGFLLNTSMQVKNRAASIPASAKTLAFLHAYRQRLSEGYAQAAEDRDSIALAALEEKANTLEKELARTVFGYREGLRQVNWKAVQSALKPGEAAVEFIHFQAYDQQGKPADSIYYAALVLRSEGEPLFIPLFESRALSALLKGASGANYRKINQLYAPDKTGKSGLYHLIWKKLENPLKGSNRVYYALTGLLHRLNLNAVQSSAQNRWQGVVLGSTRQLALPPKNVSYPQNALLIGGVNYAGKNSAIAAFNQELRSDKESTVAAASSLQADSLHRGEDWHYLPATRTEVLRLYNILSDTGMKVKLDTGYVATEESVKLQAPTRILHFATHGYFFAEPSTATLSGASTTNAFKTAKNPLLRSGLILAGAQEVWSTGRPPEGREDGVLTAQEISLLDLSGTELVVLSACETGLGDIDGNEGVYGLQRAFKIAGVKYIVMSLWKINDQTTHEFMTEFYGQWIKKGLKIPEAFQNARKVMQLKYPEEAYHWAGFVLVE